MAKKFLVVLVLMMVFLATTSSVVVAQPGPPSHPLCEDSGASGGGQGTVTCTHPASGETCTLTYEDTIPDGHFTPHQDDIVSIEGDICPPVLDKLPF